jgi:hypothetical protein
MQVEIDSYSVDIPTARGRDSAAACSLRATQDSVGLSSTMLPPQRPGPEASAKERTNYLDAQLDTITGTLILGNMVVLDGLENRLHGGVRLSFCC